MRHYDPFLAGWQLVCPETEAPVCVQLKDFRQIERFAGSTSPPTYHIQYWCDACLATHHCLLTQDQLDLAPVTEPFAPHYDFMSGRFDWEGGGAGWLWSIAIRKGYWPLRLECAREQKQVGAWPSVLTRIEPNNQAFASRYLVSYTCPHCHHSGCEEWGAGRLALSPRY